MADNPRNVGESPVCNPKSTVSGVPPTSVIVNCPCGGEVVIVSYTLLPFVVHQLYAAFQFVLQAAVTSILSALTVIPVPPITFNVGLMVHTPVWVIPVPAVTL